MGHAFGQNKSKVWATNLVVPGKSGVFVGFGEII